MDQTLSLKEGTWYDNIIVKISTVIFALTIVLASIQVVFRFITIDFIGSLSWTEPVARASLIVGTFFGAAVASRNNMHIQMDLLSNRIKENHPLIDSAIHIINIITTTMFIVVALAGIIPAAIHNIGTTFGGVRLISQGHIFAGISVGMLIMFIYEIINGIEEIKHALFMGE